MMARRHLEPDCRYDRPLRRRNLPMDDARHRTAGDGFSPDDHTPISLAAAHKRRKGQRVCRIAKAVVVTDLTTRNA